MYNATLLHVPHASVEIPPKYRKSFVCSDLKREIGVMTDWFCDELFACNREQLVFPVSRLVCDAERFRDDKDEIMAEIGMGTVYRVCSDLSPLRKSDAAEKEEILGAYYDMHHQRFTQETEKRLADFGRCLIVDCHSFYPVPLTYELNQQEFRPDFCIGTDEFHTPRRVINFLCDYFKSKGYTVAVDAPFAGTIVPMPYYQKDIRVSSVMIEVNRRLYMDSPGRKSKHFAEINAILTEGIYGTETLLSGSR